MSDDEPREKSRPVPDRPGRNGGMLVTGGRDGGRPPDEFKRRMREMASAEDALAYLEECLRGEHGPKAAVAAHKHVTERGYGKVPQQLDVGGGDGGPLKIVVERDG